MERSRFAFILVLSLILASTVPAHSATPSSGTIGPPSGTSVSWAGQFYAAAATVVPEACPPAIDPANALCDHFYLTVNVTPTYWDSNTGGAAIEIHWPSSDNDFDLWVYDNDDGTLVDFSAAGGTTSESVFIESASGTYEVRVNPFLVVASGYDGSATFISQVGGPTPNPPRSTGGLAFSPPATVIDGQRTEGEPLNHIDKDGNYWESGPWGTTTSQSFIHRSTDGGAQFNIVSPAGLRPDTPPGGGDTDVVTDDQGNAYFVDLEALVNLGCSVSHDDGNTWRKNAVCVQSAGDDRQWFAMDNGPTGAATDNTIFLAFRQVPLGSSIFSSPGSMGPADPVGGLVYTDSSAAAPAPVSNGAPCGQLRFDPVNRNLYYPCVDGDHVEITVGHVNDSQRIGITYTNVSAPVSPGGAVGDIFPAVAIDKGGNVYAVWVDETDHNVYYSASTDQGATWGAVHQINGNDANSNVWVWAQGGNDGVLSVVWYGNSSHLDPDVMPSWYNNRQAATAFKWFGYAAMVTNATSGSPSFIQNKFTDQPMHYGQICQGGLGCTLSGGDRTMADFLAHYHDLDGSIRIVFNDTTSQHHGAHLFEVRQIAGPSAYGTTISKSVPTNPVSDATGDAQSPHYFPVTGAGANQAQLDFTGLKLSQPNANTLRVEMTLSSLASMAPPPGKANALWLTRFQALSEGDEGEEAYRIFYMGAESVAGAPPTFFAGSGNSNNNGVPGDGCVNTTAENCKIVQYPTEVAASGAVTGNVIRIDVPVSGGFGPGRPILSDTLYNVTALSAGRTPGDPIYADVDATRAIDFKLGKVKPTPTGCKVTGGGAIAGTTPGSEAPFAINALPGPKGKVDYRDNGAGVSFRSTRILKSECSGTAARIEGEGVNSGGAVSFIVDVVDNGEAGPTDTFAIRFSGTSTYSRGPLPLSRGNIQVH
jgi:hypothetical protein